jgi:rhodanese-related sulfurtransferase
MQVITPIQLKDLHQRDPSLRLIDVRTPAEYRSAHVPFAENRPLESLDPAVLVHADDTNRQRVLYVICQQGGRGANACAKLEAAGLCEAVNVAGGTAAWEQAGLPVVRGKNTISLERQVRIAAGLLVLAGLLLGIFVHPYLLGIAAFVGAGLTFAGLTETCGMGLLLARMPWNQIAADSDSSASGADSACSRG